MRDTLADLAAGGIDVLGISPDMPMQQKKFDTRYKLGFPLLSDPEHRIAETYGVWGEKKMYGKIYMGIVRSALLIDADGRVENAWYKVSPKNTVPELLKHLNR